VESILGGVGVGVALIATYVGVGLLILAGLVVLYAYLWRRILKWALRVDEALDIMSTTLREVRGIGRVLEKVLRERQTSDDGARALDVTTEKMIEKAVSPAVPVKERMSGPPKECPRCRMTHPATATHCEKCGAEL